MDKAARKLSSPKKSCFGEYVTRSPHCKPLGLKELSHDIPRGLFTIERFHMTSWQIDNKTAAVLVCQTNPVGVKLFSYVNTFFCSNKFAKLLVT